MKILVKIPSNRVNHGIIASLKNSRRINKLARSIFRKDDFFLSLVMYYYALEEFGKALLLEQEKKKQKNQKEIQLYLRDHHTKLKLVKKIHNDLIIKKTRRDKIRSIKHSKFNTMTLFEEIRTIRDFFDLKSISVTRTGFWLVDYDPKKKRWNTYEEKTFLDEDLSNSISRLFRKIRIMEKNYKK